VAVISYRLWQRHFGGAASVVGTPVTLEGVPFTIVGVTPPEFLHVEVGRTFDVAVPLGTQPLIRGKHAVIDQPRALFLIVMLRLKPEQSLEAATATLRAMQPDILGVTPEELARVKPPNLAERLRWFRHLRAHPARPDRDCASSTSDRCVSEPHCSPLTNRLVVPLETRRFSRRSAAPAVLG
jgi:hypothetical protein